VFILEDFFAAIGDFLYSLFDSLLTNSSIKSRKKQEKKLGESKNFKVYRTKTEQIFFLIFLLVALIGMALIAFFWDIPLRALLLIEGIIAVVSLLPLFGYLNCKFNYYVVSEENIVHHSLFGKNKTIEYSDIFYILYRNKGDFLTAYNKYGTILFHLESSHIGIERLTDILEEKGIRRESTEILTEEMKNSEEYRLRQRKDSLIIKISVAVFIAFWVSLILMLVL
jgi:hypothetical protein